jgi:hypothetical protein
MCDIGEPPVAWKKTIIKKARKQHECFECLSVIDAGESYVRINAIYSFGPETFKYCCFCNSKWDEYSELLSDIDCAVGSLWDAIAGFE